MKPFGFAHIYMYIRVVPAGGLVCCTGGLVCCTGGLVCCTGGLVCCTVGRVTGAVLVAAITGLPRLKIQI